MGNVWVYALVMIFVFRKATGFLIGKIALKEPERYALFIILYYPAMAAYVTSLDWGQPLIYGILAQRNFGTVFFPLLLLDFLMRAKIKLNDVEKALVFLGWAQLVFSFGAFVFHWQQFMHDAAIKGEILKAPFYFLVVGSFYYNSRSVVGTTVRDKLFNAFYGLCFLTGLIVIFKGRSLVLSILASWGIIFFARRSSLNKKSAWLILFTIFLFALFLVVFFGMGQYLGPQIQKFMAASGEAIKVISGKASADPSSNIRLQDISFMMRSTKHWLVGTGEIYPKWVGHGGPTTPDSFYTSDIGWYGIIYLYGLIGLIIANGQFVLALRYRLPSTRLEREALFLTCQSMSLFCFLRSMITMEVLTYPAISLTFIFLMWYMAREQDANTPRPVSQKINREDKTRLGGWGASRATV